MLKIPGNCGFPLSLQKVTESEPVWEYFEIQGEALEEFWNLPQAGAASGFILFYFIYLLVFPWKRRKFFPWSYLSGAEGIFLIFF